MDYHQDHRHHLHHPRTKTSWIYLILSINLILSFNSQGYGSEIIKKWHPFYDVEYSLYWYLALGAWSLKPFLYAIVAIVAKPRHRILIIVFMIYEGILFLDYILVYSQSQVREPIAILLAVYMIFFHYKYEHLET